MVNEKWSHRDGDRYFVVAYQYVGDQATGYHPQYRLLSGPHEYREQAWRRGLVVLGHDDFVLAVVRDGQLAALLWDDELVDDDSAVLTDVITQTKLASEARQ